MQYVWDETGKRYLDAFAGIVTVSVGHCHPKVIEKIDEQNGKLQHTDDDLPAPDRSRSFAEKLASHMPEGLDADVLHELGERGERGRDPLGPRVHRQSPT